MRGAVWKSPAPLWDSRVQGRTFRVCVPPLLPIAAAVEYPTRKGQLVGRSTQKVCRTADGHW